LLSDYSHVQLPSTLMRARRSLAARAAQIVARISDYCKERTRVPANTVILLRRMALATGMSPW
jgi:hypothetical protein